MKLTLTAIPFSALVLRACTHEVDKRPQLSVKAIIVNDTFEGLPVREGQLIILPKRHKNVIKGGLDSKKPVYYLDKPFDSDLVGTATSYLKEVGGFDSRDGRYATGRQAINNDPSFKLELRKELTTSLPKVLRALAKQLRRDENNLITVLWQDDLTRHPLTLQTIINYFLDSTGVNSQGHSLPLRNSRGERIGNVEIEVMNDRLEQEAREAQAELDRRKRKN